MALCLLSAGSVPSIPNSCVVGERWRMKPQRSVDRAIAASVQAGTPESAGPEKTCLLLDVSSQKDVLLYVSPQGKIELRDRLGELAGEVLRKSEQLADNPSGTEPEIGRSHVREALRAVISSKQHRRDTGWIVLLRCLFSVCLFIAGIGFSNLRTIWGALLLAAGAIGAGSSIAVLVILGDR
jgi:hypothetical protein